jgi:hypothetical protein
MLGSQSREKYSLKWLTPISIGFTLSLTACSSIQHEKSMNAEPAAMSTPHQQAPTSSPDTSQAMPVTKDTTHYQTVKAAERDKVEMTHKAEPALKHQIPQAKEMAKSVEHHKVQSHQVAKEVKKQIEQKPSLPEVKTETAVATPQPAEKPAMKVVETAKEKMVDKAITKAEEKIKKTGAPLPLGHKFGEFILEKGYDGSNPNACRLRVGTNQFQRDSVAVQYWVSLTPRELKIYTSAQSSASIKGTGVKIDNGPLHPFTRIDNMTNPVVEQDITDEIAAGKIMNIYLGFSFINPKNSPQHIKINLDHMEKGIIALKACD